MFPIRLPHKVSERVTRQIPGFIAAATSATLAGRARGAAAGSKRTVRFGGLVALALMTLTACSTVEDGWDSMFGSSDSEDGGNQPEGLHGVSQPPAYSNGAGVRKAPSEQYALNDTPAAPTPAPAETKPAAAPVEKTAPKAEPVPAPPGMAAQPNAPTPVVPPVAPPPESYPVPTYVPPSPYEAETTTVISGNGKVSVQSYDPAPYNNGVGGGASRAVSNTGGLGMGLSMTGLGPYPLEAYSHAGTSVSLQVASIQFGDGTAGLSAQDRAILRQVVALQKQHGGVLRVIGHASSRTGDMSWDHHDTANLKVSQQRAKTVMRALMELGAPSSSLYVGAMADNEPLYQESMPAGEAGNRRTEIYLDY